MSTPEAATFARWARVRTASALIPDAVCSTPASSAPPTASAILSALPSRVYSSSVGRPWPAATGAIARIANTTKPTTAPTLDLMKLSLRGDEPIRLVVCLDASTAQPECCQGAYADTCLRTSRSSLLPTRRRIGDRPTIRRQRYLLEAMVTAAVLAKIRCRPAPVRHSHGPSRAGLSMKRLMGFEPTTFCMASSADGYDG